MLKNLAVMAVVFAIFFVGQAAFSAENARIRKWADTAQLSVLYWHAQSCPPCGKMTPIVNKVYRQRRDIRWAHIELRKIARPPVSVVPTLTAYRHGREIGRLQGLASANTIKVWLNRLQTR
jgi:thioredoxin-like negative regulator of GroEL